jgi:restriction system protein
VEALGRWEFERALCELLNEHGWNAVVTKGSGDEGVDIVLKTSARTVLVQCKAHDKKIGPAPIRELYGTVSCSMVYLWFSFSCSIWA